jgi:hypothetical protein
MLFALAEYGCFHIWHKDADLYVMDLDTKAMWPLDKANSPFPESYHVWSSTGRWILFASRRDDTNYSRLYIAHMNEDGTSDKAFLLPQSLLHSMISLTGHTMFRSSWLRRWRSRLMSLPRWLKVNL